MHAGLDFGPLVVTQTQLECAELRHVVHDGEDERLLAAQYDRVARHDRDVGALVERDHELGIHAGLQLAVRILRAHLHGKGAATGVASGKDTRYRALERAAGIRVDIERGGAALAEPRYGRLLDAERDLGVAGHQRGNRRRDLHHGPGSHEALSDDAGERGDDLGLVEADLQDGECRLLLRERRLRLAHRRLRRRAVLIGVRVPSRGQLRLRLCEVRAGEVDVERERFPQLLKV